MKREYMKRLEELEHRNKEPTEQELIAEFFDTCSVEYLRALAYNYSEEQAIKDFEEWRKANGK
ncbi:hypothetical protein NHG23_05250 [Aerococcaceae bacterium NML190073]|nr:hypothetical protein [Aerococcaceae bacterium NML190073]